MINNVTIFIVNINRTPFITIYAIIADEKYTNLDERCQV
jgi:hypothetical protein